MATYVVNGDDQAYPLEGLPEPCPGAPLPMVLSNEHNITVAYRIATPPEPDWDGTTVRVVGRDTEPEFLAVAIFRGYHSYYMGAPNDEALQGHPLADRGLASYAAFDIRPSSWIKSLERMNSVHPNHDPERFENYYHFVVAFHDTTFECVATSCEVETHMGSVRSLTPRMTEILEGKAE